MCIKLLKLAVVLVGCTFLSLTFTQIEGERGWAATAQSQPASPPQASDIASWKTFANRAGWSIKHPPDWLVGSCRNCKDLSDPKIFVSFYDSASTGLVMIELVVEKPADQNIDQWLNHVRKRNANPQLSEEMIFLDGMRALRVKHRNRDATESEDVYVVNGSKAFAIGASVFAMFDSIGCTSRCYLLLDLRVLECVLLFAL